MQLFKYPSCRRRSITKCWLLGAWRRLAWLAPLQGLSRGPVIIKCFLSHSGIKTKASEASDEHRERGMLTATEVLLCFGLLLITVWHSGKAPVSAAASGGTLPGQQVGGGTHSCLVWLPSGRTWALKTGVHSPGTPACTRIQDHKFQRSKKGGRSKKLNRSPLPDKHLRDFNTLMGLNN